MQAAEVRPRDRWLALGLLVAVLAVAYLVPVSYTHLTLPTTPYV